MKKYRIRFLSLFLVLLFLTGAIGCGSRKEVKEMDTLAEAKSDFYGSVEELMKNSSGREMAVGDEIPVLENQFTYTDGEGTRVTCHVERYKMMEPGNEYFLYLYYSEHDQWFVILSGLLGKVPVSENEEVLFPASEISLFSGQQAEEDSETKRVLEEIREESLAKYGKEVN